MLALPAAILPDRGRVRQRPPVGSRRAIRRGVAADADRVWTVITVQFRDELYALIASQKAELAELRAELAEKG